MKSLLTLTYFSVLFFSAFFIDNTSEGHSSEEDLAITTMVKICDIGTTPPSADSPCPPHGVLELIVDENCIGRGVATVRVANLVSNPNLHQTYYLPNETFDIYYEYTTAISGTNLIGPINSFTFKGEYYQNLDAPIFEFTADMYIDVSSECAYKGEVSLPMTVKLLDEYGSTYPIANYAGMDEMFDCRIFYETCNFCAPAIPECDGGAPPIYNILACGACETCLIGTVKADTNEEHLLINENRDVDDSKEFISFQPNPFTDYLTLQYKLENKSEINVEIMDANGVVVQQTTIIQEVGDQSLNIDTHQLLNGIYFCRVKIGSDTFTKKIVKVKP